MLHFVYICIKLDLIVRKEDVKYDCSYFEGHIPCKPNKQFDVQCDTCSYYEKDISSIIKLDTQESLVKEIYKICNFKEESIYEFDIGNNCIAIQSKNIYLNINMDKFIINIYFYPKLYF